MRKDKTYQLLLEKMHEVAVVPPQTIGPFTGMYKKVVPFLKFSPWKSMAAISFALAVFLYILLGSAIVRFASILQFGF